MKRWPLIHKISCILCKKLIRQTPCAKLSISLTVFRDMAKVCANHIPIPPLNRMTELLLTLLAIALLDSLSMIPIAIVPLAWALCGARPLASALAFISGIYLTYLLCGGLLVLGMGALFKHLGAYFSRLWHQPNALELGVQIALGCLLFLSSIYLLKACRRKADVARSLPASPQALFALGVTLTLAGMPGAVPYAAAAERIARFDGGWDAVLSLLVFYNVCFVAPFLTLIALHLAFPHLSKTCFGMLGKFASAALPVIAAGLFMLLGGIMVADGIGWFLGHPLLPVQTLP